LITDLSTQMRYCHHCCPASPEAAGAIKVSRKIHAVRRRLEDYPLADRLKDLKGEE